MQILQKNAVSQVIEGKNAIGVNRQSTAARSRSCQNFLESAANGTSASRICRYQRGVSSDFTLLLAPALGFPAPGWRLEKL